MAKTNPQSRVEEILASMAGSYSGELPESQSRIEELLLAIHDLSRGCTKEEVIDSLYPIGSLYMSINNTMPSALTEGRTWELLSGNYVLKTITEGTGGQASNAGETGSTTLTAAQSGVPAHSHGLNSHTHSIPALSGSAGYVSLTGNMWLTHGRRDFEHAEGILSTNNAGQGTTVAWTGDSGNQSGNTLYVNASHSHSVTTNASTTGAATGSTANNGAANASEGHTHTAGMPQNIGIYIWKRTA